MTAIVTNYNHAEYLYQSVTNLAQQTRKVDEIIVVDDCSTDHSRDVLELLAKEFPEIIVILHERNLGVVRAIQTGLGRATGDYLTTLGADDPLSTSFFERAMAVHAIHPEGGFCSAEYQLLFPGNTSGLPHPISIGLAERPRYFSPNQISEVYRARNDLSVPTAPAVWRRAVWDEVGGMHEDLRWLSDWFAALVAIKRHGYGYVPGVMQCIRFNPKSYSCSGMKERDAYFELILRVLAMLERPEYMDMQEFFRIPSVLARFGFKILRLLVEHPEYQKYLSAGLVKAAFKHEAVSLEEDLHNLKFVPAAHLADVTEKILAHAAEGMLKHTEKLKRQGTLREAAKFCSKTLDAQPSHAGAQQMSAMIDAAMERSPASRW